MDQESFKNIIKRANVFGDIFSKNIIEKTREIETLKYKLKSFMSKEDVAIFIEQQITLSKGYLGDTYQLRKLEEKLNKYLAGKG